MQFSSPSWRQFKTVEFLESQLEVTSKMLRLLGWHYQDVWPFLKEIGNFIYALLRGISQRYDSSY